MAKPKPKEMNEECSVKETRRKTGGRCRRSVGIKSLRGLCSKKFISDQRGRVKAQGQGQQ